MNKNDIRKILMSMRTTGNEEQVNSLLGKLDLMSEDEVQKESNRIGNDEESIRKYFEERIRIMQNNGQINHTPINEMFTYNVTGSSVNLHMPIPLDKINESSRTRRVNKVNLYLLDAIEKIRCLKSNNFYKFQNVNCIYMNSPVLASKIELDFLKKLDFITEVFTTEQLNDEYFVSTHLGAQIAVEKFGANKKVGTAGISIETINSKEWQDKRKKIIESFAEKGITLKQTENEKK